MMGDKKLTLNTYRQDAQDKPCHAQTGLRRAKLYRIFGLVVLGLWMSAWAPSNAAEAQQEPDSTQQSSDDKPTLFIIGDSTVKHGTHEGDLGLWGWGSFLDELFDLSEINVENHAIGGRSSRTFQTEGRWKNVLEKMEAGDYVIMQFGHNDGIAPDNPKRPRGTLDGTGEETYDIIHPKTGEPETVHTFGWYMRKYVNDAQAKDGTAIVASPIPRNIWTEEGTVVRSKPGYGLWAQQVAKETGAYFIDLNEIIAQHYEEEGPGAVMAKYFSRDHTHTTKAGAKLNAIAVVEGFMKKKDLSLNQYLTDEAKEAAAEAAEKTAAE